MYVTSICVIIRENRYLHINYHNWLIYRICIIQLNTEYITHICNCKVFDLIITPILQEFWQHASNQITKGYNCVPQAILTPTQLLHFHPQSCHAPNRQSYPYIEIKILISLCINNKYIEITNNIQIMQGLLKIETQFP